MFIIHAHSSSTATGQRGLQSALLLALSAAREGQTDRPTDGQTVCSVCATDNYNCVIFFSLATFYSRFVFVCRYSFLVFHFPFPITCAREGGGGRIASCHAHAHLWAAAAVADVFPVFLPLQLLISFA